MSTARAGNATEREDAARAWRNATTAAHAWRRFRAFVARHADGEGDDGSVPYWDVGLHFSAGWSGPSARRLVVFQKLHVMNAFIGPGPTNRAEKLRVATVLAPFSPRRFDTDLLRAHAKLLGGAPLGFVGDLSPYGLHVFGAFRSGDMNAPRLDRRVPLDLEWLGIDDSWLRRAAPTTRPHRSSLIAMGWLEREYWGIVKRLMPDVRRVIGPECFALLDEGCTLECESFEDVLGDGLSARLRRMAVNRNGRRPGSR